MKLSNQALGALMMALQNSLIEQKDIVPVLKEFNFELSEQDELVVTNPPTVRATFSDEFVAEAEEDLKFYPSDS